MANLINSSLRLALESAIDSVHETFARDIFYWKTPQEIYLTEDVNYNPFYGKPPETLERISESGVMKGRVMYNKDQKLEESVRSTEKQQVRIDQDKGVVRVKLRNQDAAIMKDAVNINFDGFDFEIDRSVRPHGLFDPKYRTFYLQVKN